ncbi:hypothetical protein VP01_4653g2 [Puccinia sorghi]|uniref:Uncharacterized protein n=1 Tax=Puccinia sorghi TaxID=27349 RepID=A0A0L6UN88_9BASI|nr:hypothetical protein VP01_4653g2 [Puccinia sorghi]
MCSKLTKELENDIQAQYDFYLGQGFFHKLENTAAQFWEDNNKPCQISHWMSMPTTGHLLVEMYNRPVFSFSSSWSQSFFLFHRPKQQPTNIIGSHLNTRRTGKIFPVQRPQNGRISMLDVLN